MAGKYQRGRSWYLSWIEDGANRRRSLGAITEAEAETARLAKEQQLGAVAAAGPLFQDWAERYAIWHAQEYPSSYFRVEQILRCHLIPTFGSVPLLAINRTLAEGYKRNRLAQAKHATVIKEWRTLQAVLNAAVAHEVIPHNPIGKVRAPRDLTSRPPRWYTREELAAIYAAQAQGQRCTTPEDRALAERLRWTWQLMANTGLRRTEALQLDWRDCGKEAIVVRSEESARTKSGRWRQVPVSQGAAEALEALAPKKRQGPVVPQIQPPSVTRAFARTLRRAELDGNLHCLRHTYCSHLVQAGIPLRTVQVLAGHASMSTTERYAHLSPDTLQAAISGLNL
jgi:integrase